MYKFIKLKLISFQDIIFSYMLFISMQDVKPRQDIIESNIQNFNCY